MSKGTKPAVWSLGVWGGVGSVISWVYALVEIFNNLPPELIDDTKMVWAMILGVVSAVMALIGRWKAVLPIDGVFTSK